MALSQEMQVARHRLVMFCLGGVAALALWGLAENWQNPALPPPLYLALFTMVTTYCGVALALAGPVSVARALSGAVLIALPVTALVSLAGLRYEVATDLLDEPVMLSVTAVLVLVSVPFLLVRLQSPAQWRSYAALFDAAWTTAVRYGVGGIFVGVFWLVLFLSNALLRLVGVDIIERLLETDWAPFVLSGAVLGLGLAVVYELRNTISPFLVLRLLRLLVPVVLVVLVVFLGAVPIRGLGDLFGEFSSAATLMGAAIVAITLISTALDRDDKGAVHTRGIRIATRGLAVLLPLLAALAVWAVVLRVRQYGWTPDRILAMMAAVFVLAYGLGYALAVLRGQGWAARVRQVNVAMALAIIVVSALWLTPVLNPLRISANNQVARYEVGKITLDQLPFWSLEHDWGKAGQAALTRLEEQSDQADRPELLVRIDAARSQPSRYRFRRVIEESQTPATLDDLADLMVVRPEAAGLPDGMLARAPFYQSSRWLKGCRQTLPDGRPGCVLVLGPFSPALDVIAQGMVLYLDDQGRTRANHLLLPQSGDLEIRDVYDPVAGRWASLPAGAISQALDGAFDIAPSGANALFVGGATLVPEN